MKRWLPLLVCIATAVGLAGCEREMRRFATPAGNSTTATNAPRAGGNQPGQSLTGGVSQALKNVSPYDDNAYAVSQGKHLFSWYNCSGCHGSGGGGGMGPPLRDAGWRYGSDPASIFQTITQGRPNGMPAFGGHIPDDQVWQLVAYVRSMSGLLRKDVAPSRSDTMNTGPAENARDRQQPTPEQASPYVPGAKP